MRGRGWIRCVSVTNLLLLLFFIAIIVLFVMNRNFLIEHLLTDEDESASLVYMSPMERKIISAYLNTSHSMLEYGSGYSTLYFSRLVLSYYAIEHDRHQHRRIQNLLERSPRMYPSIRQYVLVPIDPGYRGWPGGVVEGTRHQFEPYITVIRTLGVKKFDRVLIDGRARLPCMIEVYAYLHKHSIVFVHDYTHRRYHSNITDDLYKLVLQTFEGQTLAVFRPRM